MTTPVLEVYLRNHEAAAHAGLALFRRAVRAQRRRPWGSALKELSRDVRADLESLRQVMESWNITPDRRLATLLQVGELLGRAKPNGRLISRSPLSDLIEVEAMLDAVHAKWCGWEAILAADLCPKHDLSKLTQLQARAEDQQHRLQEVHRAVAARVLR